MVEKKDGIVKVGTIDCHLLTLELQRVSPPACYQHVTAVHGVLEDIHHGDTLSDEVDGRHQGEHEGVTMIMLQAVEDGGVQ